MPSIGSLACSVDVCCSLRSSLLLSTVPLATNAARPAPAATSVEAQADTVVSAAMKEQSIQRRVDRHRSRRPTLVAAGYGLANVELDVKASPSTVYRIGSLTKQFTAASSYIRSKRAR